MKCPRCGTLESRVKKTLIHTEQMGGPPGFSFGELKMRARACMTCKRHFQTFEVHEAVFQRILALTPPIVEVKLPAPTPPPPPALPVTQPPALPLPITERRALKTTPATPPPKTFFEHRRSLDD